MPQHTTNRAVFVKCDANEPLLALYTTLVAIELTLKDRCGKFNLGHELQMLVTAAFPSSTVPSGLQAALTTLDGSIKKLKCTDKKTGLAVDVAPSFYPGVRYLRFQKDGFTDGSPDADVAQALRDAKQLLQELKRAGVTV